MNKFDNLWKDMIKGNLFYFYLSIVRVNNKFY